MKNPKKKAELLLGKDTLNSIQTYRLSPIMEKVLTFPTLSRD
jgi:hypothetical protein